MRIDYNLKDKFDFGLIFPVIILYFIGLAAIYSSTYNNPSAQGNFERQIIWGIAALIVFFITYFLPTNTFKLISIPTYLLSVLLLIIVLLIGRRISGAQSWMTIGPIGFQPSEFAKIGTILALSRFLSKRSMDIDSFKDRKSVV